MCSIFLEQMWDVYKVIVIRLESRECDTVVFSMDSDLEAFSHNPTNGSFAALAVQATARTKYSNQRFLSY